MCRLQRLYNQKPKCLSFLETIPSTYFAFSLIQYAHLLMSHIFAARLIMTSCAEFIIRWTSLFTCLLLERFIVSCLTVLHGFSTFVWRWMYFSHLSVLQNTHWCPCYDLYFSVKQHYNTALILSEKVWQQDENWKKWLSMLHAVLSNGFSTGGRVEWVGRGKTALPWYKNQQDNII